MRGDPPRYYLEPKGCQKSTPHARGSTVRRLYVPLLPYVYPACAGIHLIKRALEYSLASLPRMRGDPPLLSLFLVGSGTSTPHARGSTSTAVSVWTAVAVYPACAGIHRSMENDGRLKNSLPRMRGDPPKIKEKKAAISGSTPHARGSTLRCLHYTGRREVYPACAGIHPLKEWVKYANPCLPRMRGDPP